MSNVTPEATKVRCIDAMPGSNGKPVGVRLGHDYDVVETESVGNRIASVSVRVKGKTVRVGATRFKQVEP